MKIEHEYGQMNNELFKVYLKDEIAYIYAYFGDVVTLSYKNQMISVTYTRFNEYIKYIETEQDLTTQDI